MMLTDFHYLSTRWPQNEPRQITQSIHRLTATINFTNFLIFASGSF